MSKITATIDKKLTFKPFTVNVEIVFENKHEVNEWLDNSISSDDLEPIVYDVVDKVTQLIKNN